MGFQFRSSPFPAAYACISEVDVPSSFVLSVYPGVAVRWRGWEPMERRTIELTPEEQKSFRNELTGILYRYLKDRPEYRGGAEV